MQLAIYNMREDGVFETHFAVLCQKLGRITPQNYANLDSLNAVLLGPVTIIAVSKDADDNEWNQMASLLFPNVTIPHLIELAAENNIIWQDVMNLDLTADFDIMNGKADEQQPLYTLKFLYELARRRGDSFDVEEPRPTPAPANQA